MKNLSELRKSYERGELDEPQASDDPRHQFGQWLQHAIDSGAPEPTAMTLATVGEGGRPSTRIVLLKRCDEHGLVWYTNYLSRKGRELGANPRAALQFHWVDLERVVRVEGTVARVEESDSDAYYQSRPLASRIGAWASEQSAPISSRAVLVAKAAEYGLKFALHPPRPPHWGGYRLQPEYWEFWQGRTSRLHDRLAYSLGSGGAWSRQRLAP